MCVASDRLRRCESGLGLRETEWSSGWCHLLFGWVSDSRLGGDPDLQWVRQAFLAEAGALAMAS